MTTDLIKKTYLRAKECVQHTLTKSQLHSFLHFRRVPDLPENNKQAMELIDKVIVFSNPDKIKQQINNKYTAVSEKIDNPYISPNQRDKENPLCDNGRQGASPLADFFKGCRNLAVLNDKTTQQMVLDVKGCWPPTITSIQKYGKSIREVV